MSPEKSETPRDWDGMCPKCNGTTFTFEQVEKKPIFTGYNRLFTASCLKNDFKIEVILL